MDKTQERFLSTILPGLRRNAHSYANCFHFDPEKREEFLADVVATAWQGYVGASREDLHAGHFWWIALKRWQTGRGIAGCSTRRIPPSYLSPLDEADDDALFDSEPDPADKAVFRLDIECFKHCLSGFSRKLLALKLAGYSVAQISRLLHEPYDRVYHACYDLKQPARLYFGVSGT